jgi:hypothetical protein
LNLRVATVAIIQFGKSKYQRKFLNIIWQNKLLYLEVKKGDDDSLLYLANKSLQIKVVCKKSAIVIS